MATIITCSIPATIRASAGPGSQKKPDSNLKTSVSTSSSPSWWAPLFGWSSDPDYINSSLASCDLEKPEMSGAGREPGRRGQRFTLGCFTEEKARQMRRMTAESSSFHDMMYHSAIASRLASDVSGRVEN